jgi:hypothetical protein
MTEVSSKYKEIWNELQKKIGINSPIPPVYDSPEDLDHLNKKLHEEVGKRTITEESSVNDLLYKVWRKNFEELKKSIYQGDSGVLVGAALEERLLRYSSINPSERYKATVVEAGIIIPPAGEEKEKFLHESVHILYFECFPELAVALAYPAAFVPSEDVRVLISGYFTYLAEAMSYFTTIRMSDVIKIKREKAWKFFHDGMNKAPQIDSKLTKSMVYTICKDNHNFLDPLYVLSRYGPSTLRIYFNVLGLKATRAVEQLLIERLIERIKSDLKFMRTNFDIEVYRMLYDGSLKPLKVFCRNAIFR